MLGYVSRVQEVEKRLEDLSPMARCFWLLCINSDILSAVEKRSPHIRLRETNTSGQIQEYQIIRSERGFEGEEYLAFLEQCALDAKSPVELDHPISAHLIKAKARIKHLRSLEPIWNGATLCL